MRSLYKRDTYIEREREKNESSQAFFAMWVVAVDWLYWNQIWSESSCDWF